MGIQDLQTFLESGSIPGSTSAVDLVKIGHTMAMKARKNKYAMMQNPYKNQLNLVVDGECCLDRLYGGFYSDWACGGQWGHMLTFLTQFLQEAKVNNTDMAVFFDGTFDETRMDEWITKQLEERERINSVLKHIANKGTPPPKIWWTPPAGLRSVLRMAFRILHTCVAMSLDNHKLEILSYLKDNHFNAIVADDAEYAVFQPPRYFSSKQLKLRFSGSIDTIEYHIHELLKGLDLPPDRLCVVATLLRTEFMSAKELEDLYTKKIGLSLNKSGVSASERVRAIASFVKNLTQQDNVDAVVEEILGENHSKASALKESIIYYYSGTKRSNLGKKNNKKAKEKKDKSDKTKDAEEGDSKEEEGETSATEPSSDLANEPDLDTSQLASESQENELDNLTKYKEVSHLLKSSGPEIVDQAVLEELNNEESAEAIPDDVSKNSTAKTPTTSIAKKPVPKQPSKQKPKAQGPVLPSIPIEVLRTVSERHSEGAMCPLIHQIYNHHEIRLPVLLESENHTDVPNIYLFYRPIRQKVYAILFNLHHHTFMAVKNNSDKKLDIRIKEWVWSKSNQYTKCDLVRAEPLNWGVPTVQRLWFGTTVDDRRRRLRAFLTCMRSDSNLLLHTDHVPQHLLLMACVLRYMMTFTEKRILRREELDAFIVTAVSPEVMNTEQIQDLQLPLVTVRGVQLSTLFMAGVETALLVNDACGAPIPWVMNCPWLFFDGKLFNYYLSKASQCKSIEDLCDHRISIVIKVEKMRTAILENINYQFARPMLSPLMRPCSMMPNEMLPQEFLPMQGGGNGGANIRPIMNRGHPGANQGGPSFYNNPRHNNNFQRRLPPQSSVGGAGGKLEVAGVVVGSWGPNYNFSVMPSNNRGPGLLVNPHVTSVGGYQPNLNYRPNSNVRPPTFNTMLRRRNLSNSRMQIPTIPSRRISTNFRRPNTNNRDFNRKPSRPTKPAGRGMTVSSPTTGETKLASDLLNEKKTENEEAHTKTTILNGTTDAQFDNTIIVNGTNA